MKKPSKYILTVLVILVFLIGVIHYATTRTFMGRVIDADTKEPIEGAVVVASWYKESWIPLGENIVKLEDVKETLTDKNGQWSIRGPSGGNSLSYGIAVAGLFYHTREPEFIIFKPGYCSWPNGFSIASCKERLKPGGNGEVSEGKSIELPKLTSKEDRIEAQNLQLPLGSGTLDKMKELIRLKNEERRRLGLGEVYK